MVAMYWLIAAAFFIGLEILTMGLTTIWFAGGALVAAITAFLRLSFPVQFAAFVIVSLVLLLITRPIATRYINEKAIRTNVDSLIGQNCLVTQAIDNLRAQGQVTVKGQSWSARSWKEDVSIPENSIVRIEKVSGVKVIVSIVSAPGQAYADPDQIPDGNPHLIEEEEK